MNKILSSASKIAFLLIMVTVCATFFMGQLEAKDFMVIASMAATFYFANKGTQQDNYLNK